MGGCSTCDGELEELLAAALDGGVQRHVDIFVDRDSEGLVQELIHGVRWGVKSCHAQAWQAGQDRGRHEQDGSPQRQLHPA